jgi:uncharacterized protein (TIGR00369 family)
MTHQPRDPDWEARCRANFAAQGMMTTLGASILSARPGEFIVACPIIAAISQQHGYAHAGAAWTLADTSAGFAAQSLMGAGEGVLTVEMKINLLAPAQGDRLIATGRVERAGRRLTIVRADVSAEADGVLTPVATALGTMMTMTGKE